MCTFQDEHAVLVCDAAINHVRKTVDAAFGAAVQYTMVEGKGTLIEATSTVEVERFQNLTRTAIAEAQNTPGTLPDTEQ